jgi:hypothetical protein
MKQRKKLLESIAETIADYRGGEIPTPTLEHVNTWIERFDKEVQEPLLDELNRVFKQTYISKANTREFLSKLVKNDKLAGKDHCSFWEGVQFLKIQGGGNSQREMLLMFDEVLQEECGLDIGECGEDGNRFLYLDDGIFSGNRVRNDLVRWIESDAPSQAQLNVVVIVMHLGGQYYADDYIQRAAQKVNKKVDISWWRFVEIEDRKANINISEVLRPASLPSDGLTRAYVKMLKEAGFAPVLRQSGKMGKSNIFSSETGRDLLEQQLLHAGLQIKEMCPNLKENHRPLGYSVLKTLGFGSLVVTFRNCPNNCPLAFWVDDPWYPLFPRKTN